MWILFGEFHLYVPQSTKNTPFRQQSHIASRIDFAQITRIILLNSSSQGCCSKKVAYAAVIGGHCEAWSDWWKSEGEDYHLPYDCGISGSIGAIWNWVLWWCPWATVEGHPAASWKGERAHPLFEIFIKSLWQDQSMGLHQSTMCRNDDSNYKLLGHTLRPYTLCAVSSEHRKTKARS